MQLKDPGIVFMGTPEFAVASLEAIISAGYKVNGVVTAPDKPSGRGLHMHPSPVKEVALSHNIPVFQPFKLKDPEFLDALHQLKHSLQVVVAFRMLPEEVWSMPSLGTFNLHASLLPQYRGAAPINWAVINGETKTGVTTFYINNEIDKGSIIYSVETPIGENETAGDVHDRLMHIGADLVVKTINGILEGNVIPLEQHLTDAALSLKPAPKLFRENCRILWDNETTVLHNFIRGLSPHPAAWTEIQSGSSEPLNVKILGARPVLEHHLLKPGDIMTDGKSFIWVAANDGYISIDKIQLQAKKQMNVQEFLRGFAITGYKFV